MVPLDALCGLRLRHLTAKEHTRFTEPLQGAEQAQQRAARVRSRFFRAKTPGRELSPPPATRDSNGGGAPRLGCCGRRSLCAQRSAGSGENSNSESCRVGVAFAAVGVAARSGLMPCPGPTEFKPPRFIDHHHHHHHHHPAILPALPIPDTHNHPHACPLESTPRPPTFTSPPTPGFRLRSRAVDVAFVGARGSGQVPGGSSWQSALLLRPHHLASFPCIPSTLHLVAPHGAVAAVLVIPVLAPTPAHIPVSRFEYRLPYLWVSPTTCLWVSPALWSERPRARTAQ